MMNPISTVPPTGYVYGFTQHSRAWYAEACKFAHDIADEVLIGLYADDGSCRWEFGIRWHYLPESAPRVEVFNDAWQAFAEVPALFIALAARDKLTPSECCNLLENGGFVDRTPVKQR